MGKIDQNCRIYFSLKDIDPYYKQNYNDKYMDTIKHALSEVGFNLILGEDHVSLSVNPEKYNRQKTRKAGRHKKNMKNSEYYKHINPSETYEKIYLESLPGNYLF